MERKRLRRMSPCVTITLAAAETALCALVCVRVCVCACVFFPPLQDTSSHQVVCFPPWQRAARWARWVAIVAEFYWRSWGGELLRPRPCCNVSKWDVLNLIVVWLLIWIPSAIHRASEVVVLVLKFPGIMTIIIWFFFFLNFKKKRKVAPIVCPACRSPAGRNFMITRMCVIFRLHFCPHSISGRVQLQTSLLTLSCRICQRARDQAWRSGMSPKFYEGRRKRNANLFFICSACLTRSWNLKKKKKKR